MEATVPFVGNPTLMTAFWSAATIFFYIVSKAIYRRWQQSWLSPLIVTPATADERIVFPETCVRRVLVRANGDPRVEKPEFPVISAP